MPSVLKIIKPSYHNLFRYNLLQKWPIKTAIRELAVINHGLMVAFRVWKPSEELSQKADRTFRAGPGVLLA